MCVYQPSRTEEVCVGVRNYFCARVSMASELLGTLETTLNSGSTSSVTSYFITAPRRSATSLSDRP